MKLLKNILSAVILTAILMLMIYFVELISENPTFTFLNWKGFLIFSAITFSYLMWQKSKKKEDI